MSIKETKWWLRIFVELNAKQIFSSILTFVIWSIWNGKAYNRLIALLSTLTLNSTIVREIYCHKWFISFRINWCTCKSKSWKNVSPKQILTFALIEFVWKENFNIWWRLNLVFFLVTTWKSSGKCRKQNFEYHFSFQSVDQIKCLYNSCLLPALLNRSF